MWRKAFIRRYRYLWQYCLDTFVAMSRRESPNDERVLLVRVDAIGDFILWLDAAQATVKYYRQKGKTVTLVANATWADWAKELALFDDVISLDRFRFDCDWRYRFRSERSIRKLACSTAVQPTYSREWLFGDALIRVSGAKEKIGFDGCAQTMLPWQQRISNLSYTNLIPANTAPSMELIRNAEFVRGLGVTTFRAKVAVLNNVGQCRADKEFTAAIPSFRQYYVLFPGASWDGKQWGVAKFAQVAERLHGTTGWYGVVCGGKADQEIARRLCELCKAPLLNWAGRTDLPQMASILSEAQVLLTNDTSATHMAGALGVATVCVLGGGHYGRFMPYQVEQADGRRLPAPVVHEMPCFNCNWECIYPRPNGSPVPCIERITVADASRVIGDLLRLPI